MVNSNEYHVKQDNKSGKYSTNVLITDTEVCNTNPNMVIAVTLNNGIAKSCSFFSSVVSLFFHNITKSMMRLCIHARLHKILSLHIKEYVIDK